MLFNAEQTIQRLSGHCEQSEPEKDINQVGLRDHTSDHKLAIETGCHRKTWQLRENRLRICSTNNEMQRQRNTYQECVTLSDQKKIST